MRNSEIKRIKKRLEAIKQSIDDGVNERSFVFDNRSEKWQDSEKAELFDAKTEILYDISDMLEDIQTSINEYFKM